MLNPHDCFEVNLDRAAGDVIDGEAIIINLTTGAYYSLQGIGGEIWSMIAARRSTASMLDEIVAGYDVAEDDARNDLHAVLDELLAEELIVASRGDVPGHPDRSEGSPSSVVAGDPSPSPRLRMTTGSTTGRAKQPYRKPQLEVFRDMEELLALDPPAPGMSRIGWTG